MKTRGGDLLLIVMQIAAGQYLQKKKSETYSEFCAAQEIAYLDALPPLGVSENRGHVNSCSAHCLHEFAKTY